MDININEVKPIIDKWTSDWVCFAEDVLGVYLDDDQKEILRSVQNNPRTSVASGTARGKDFVAAVAAVCFLYLTPRWNKDTGELIENTKVALTAPTGRQVLNIMMPEISRLHKQAKQRGVTLPGRVLASDVKTEDKEWFLTGFKADEHNHEAWSGFHAVNTMFVITEASGISDTVFDAIEGNLQGNSRILLVFNPNTTTGYAARSQKSQRWSRFRLNSLTAPNVIHKQTIIPGQVDYNWITDKIDNWCERISKDNICVEDDDFEFEGNWYKPNDLFRVKVLGRFPKVDDSILIPEQWIEEAEERYKKHRGALSKSKLVIGVDIAGMGRDATVYCFRYDRYVHRFVKRYSGGKANHMEYAGEISNFLKDNENAIASIDTIGEGAGVYSRLDEIGYKERIISCKYSHLPIDEEGNDLTDLTGEYNFQNMRAYLYWAVRDWLDPKHGSKAMIPPNSGFREEATEVKWKFNSNGKIIIESKEEIKKRLGRSTDEFDALANTFYPIKRKQIIQDLTGVFF